MASAAKASSVVVLCVVLLLLLAAVTLNAQETTSCEQECYQVCSSSTCSCVAACGRSDMECAGCHRAQPPCMSYCTGRCACPK
ncbi:hypothetical protein BRADI_3g03556v3 [Brachypodium distachyon]|uniref:Bowman-Birk serine protease inhibitors family domain-containing protein n=1 Tax=Brachypodium distachyon TaxID=15368 RepID=A0A2K2CV12_BRADI|nr:hypothetical protein BRADI_3g03556v3 [Brachypodium distachyon]